MEDRIDSIRRRAREAATAGQRAFARGLLDAAEVRETLRRNGEPRLRRTALEPRAVERRRQRLRALGTALRAAFREEGR